MHGCCHGMRRRCAVLGVVLGLMALPALAQVQKFPDVVGVQVVARSAGVFDFDVTVSSRYDTPQRYADGFRAMSEDGRTVYGVRPLAHDHAGEQPFTRDLHGVAIPAGVKQVVIQARDQLHGWGGQTQSVVLPGR
jgi:hypothetical protein